MTSLCNKPFNEKDIKIAQRTYEFYLKEYSSILRQDFTNCHSAMLGKNKKPLLDENKIQESKINVFKNSIAYNNHLKLALSISKTINDENKFVLNHITKDAIINRLNEKNIDYAAIENLIEVFKIKRSELEEGIAKTIKKDIDGYDTYMNAINLTLYFKQDLRDSTIKQISKKLLEKAADICLELPLNQDGQKKNLDFLYEISDKLSLTRDEVAELLDVHIKEKLKEYILFELNAQIYEPERYKDEVLHENVKTVASILSLDSNEFKNIVINTLTEDIKYITNSSLKFNSYLTNIIKIATQYGIESDGVLKDKLKTAIINSVISTDTYIYEKWNGSHSEFTKNLITVVDVVNIARQHGIIDNNDLKDKVLDVIKSEEIYRLESLRYWHPMSEYYEYDSDYYKDNSKAYEKIKTAFSLTDLEIKNAMAKAKKEIKDSDDYFKDLEKKEKAMKKLKEIDAKFREYGHRKRIFIEGPYPQPMGLCQFLRTFLPL